MFFYHVIALILTSIALGACAPYYLQADAELHFADFIKKYDRKYTSVEEFQLRFEIFKKHLEKLNKWNNLYKHKNGGHVITHFADQEGHRSCVDLWKMKNKTKTIQVKEEFIQNAPDKIDYREQKLVTEVKDQGDCGCCYIFAAIGNIEGVHAKQTGELLSLSEQQALDCFFESNCDGGEAYITMKGLATTGCMAEADYPYEEEKKRCRSDPSKIKVNVKGAHIIDTPDVETLKAALVQNGAPLTISLFVPDDLVTYVGSDVLNPNNCEGHGANHAILLVGYNADPSSGKPPHWIVKNSWSTEVGDQGYYYFDFKNKCSFGLSNDTCSVG